MLQSENGAALVELGMLMPLLLMLALGVADVGRAVLAHLSLEEAAQEGALFAAYHGAEVSDTSDDIVAAVVSSTQTVTIDPAEVTVSCASKLVSDQLSAFETVDVTIAITLEPITPFLSAFLPLGIPLEASSSATVFTANCLATP